MDNLTLIIISAIASAITLFVIFYIGFKLNYRKPVKDVLLKTSFILISILISFFMTKSLTHWVLHIDLESIGMSFKYQGVEYKMIIDLLEEIIIYNKTFNELYVHFPSLKDLFLDVPNLLVTPFMYVIVFFVIYYSLKPLYYLLTFKQKRFRKKENSTISGFIGGVQVIILFSIILTPINGLNRAYQQSISNTLSRERVSLCEQIESINKYKYLCDLVEIYNSTFYAKFADEGSVDDFIFSYLTSTSFEKRDTNIENEIYLILRSSLVLEQAGIVYYLNGRASKEVATVIDFNVLSDENIEIILNSISESKYSSGVVRSLINYFIEMLNSKLLDFSKGSTQPVMLELSEEEMNNEIRVMLEFLRNLAKSRLLDMMNIDFEGVKFVDFIQNYDVDVLASIFYQGLQSRVLTSFLPTIANYLLKDFEIVLDINRQYDYYYEFDLMVGVTKLIKKYYTLDFMDLLLRIEEEDKPLLASVLNNAVKSNILMNSLEQLFSKFSEKVEITTRMLYKVENWEDEVDIIISAVRIINDYEEGRPIDLLDLYNAVIEFGNSTLAAPIVKSLVNKKIIELQNGIYDALHGLLG